MTLLLIKELQLTSIVSNYKIDIRSKLEWPQHRVAHKVLQLNTFNYPNVPCDLRVHQKDILIAKKKNPDHKFLLHKLRKPQNLTMLTVQCLSLLSHRQTA